MSKDCKGTKIEQKLKRWIRLITIMIIFIIILVLLNIIKSVNNQDEKLKDINKERNLSGNYDEEKLKDKNYEDIKGFKSSVNTLNYNKLSEEKVKEISYKDVYNQEGKYIVLYTHEKCKYCMEFWTDKFSDYIREPNSLPTYVVDLAENSNMVAWDEYDIEGIPYLMTVDNSQDNLGNNIRKATGLKNSIDLINILIADSAEEVK